MTDRYNTEEMQDALSEIVTWYKTDPINFIAEWKNLFEQNAPDGVRLDANRRRVTRFFENIAQLYIGGYIDKKLAALISNYSGAHSGDIRPVIPI
jgi:hypothetical protein